VLHNSTVKGLQPVEHVIGHLANMFSGVMGIKVFICSPLWKICQIRFGWFSQTFTQLVISILC